MSSSPTNKRNIKPNHLPTVNPAGQYGVGPDPTGALQHHHHLSHPVDPYGAFAQPQPQPPPHPPASATQSRKRTSSGQQLQPHLAPAAAVAPQQQQQQQPPQHAYGGGGGAGGVTQQVTPLTAGPGVSPVMDPVGGAHAQQQQQQQQQQQAPPPKRGRTNTPWTPAEEQRLKQMRDAGNSWSEIAKSFPQRTEGSVKKHWYKDMHYAEFAADESVQEAALLAAIKEYEANKWKEIGKKVGKPAKACEQFAKEHFQGKV